MSKPEVFALVGDIGGTNARLSLVNLEDGSLHKTAIYSAVTNDSLESVIKKFKQETLAKFNSACIAIATPITGDHIKMTNNPWEFSISGLKEHLGLEQLIFINDFQAMSMSVTAIPRNEMVKIGGKEPEAGAPMAIYGAGTGLGAGYLIKCGDQYLPLSGEGGHVDFAPSCPEDDKLLPGLRELYPDHVSAERLLSGNGLLNLHKVIAKLNGHKVQGDLEPACITKGAFCEQADPDCVETVQAFCRLMGSFGGNLAVTLMTKGGVYIAGGIVPRFVDSFAKSGFRSSFERKGRFEKILKDIPVYVITDKEAGLKGAGAYIRQLLGAKL